MLPPAGSDVTDKRVCLTGTGKYSLSHTDALVTRGILWYDFTEYFSEVKEFLNLLPD